MSFTYSVNFGVQGKNRIIYDRTSCRLITVFNEEENGGNVILYSPKSGLSLYVGEKSGNIAGLDTHIGELESLPSANLAVSDYVDGCVIPVWDCGKLIAGCKYIINFDNSVAYDRQNGVLLLGNFSEESITVKICENAFLIIDNNGNLHGCVILL